MSDTPIADAIRHDVAAAKAEVSHLLHRDRPRAAAPSFTPARSSQQPQPEEQVSTPQQPASVVESLHAITGEIQANKLVARLVQYGMGKLLNSAEADSVVTLIAGIEKPRAQVAAAADPNAAQQ